MRTRSPHSLRAVGALAAAVVVVLAGCASAATDSAPAQSGAQNSHSTAQAEPALSGRVTVFAAASLKAGFDELATAFEQQNPQLDVVPITYDGSSTLATQIIEGAAVDVFASADEKNMSKVTDAGLAGAPQLFATNTLTLVVPKGNPANVTGLADLARAELAVVLCAVEVPCGAASTTLLGNAGVVPAVDSYEQNVTAVLTKVASGEADAGLVYVTDARSSADVEAVAAAGADDVVNRYPIAALTAAKNPEAARAFIQFVLSREGQSVLDDLGFGAP